MKKSTLLASAMLFLGSFSLAQLKPIAQEIVNLNQEKQVFQKLSLFETLSKPEKNDLVKDAQFLKLDLNKLKNYSKTGNPNIEISLPYNGKTISIQLTENTVVFDKGFHVTDENFKSFDYQPGKYYKGIIEGDTNSLVGISIFDDEVIGVISSDTYGNLTLGALKNADGSSKKNATEYILYSDRNLPMQNLGEFCGADQVPENQNFDFDFTSNKSTNFETNFIPTMYLEIDYNIYQFHGRDMQKVMDFVTATYNNVQLLYANDDIQVALRSVMVWTSQDPYQSVGNSSLAYLEKFRKTRASFDANVGQLVGVDPGGLGGIAYVSALCGSNNYSYSDISNLTVVPDVPTYHWNTMVITHEFGHNLGSSHTHACVWNGNNTAIDNCVATEGGCTSAEGIPADGGTIMSYCHLQSVGINLAKGFGPQPRQRIIDYINSRTCLPSDLNDVNITYHPIYEVKNLTQNSADIHITLNNDEIISWDYKLSRFNQGIPTTWTRVENSNVINLTGLDPNTYYRLRIRNAKDVSNNAGVDLVVVTDGDFCSNTLQFVDFGGPNTRYIPNENWVRTLMPQTAGSKIKVAFNAFNTEAGNDILRVYDGVNVEATELTPTAGLSGNITTNLPTYEATNEQGALTFKFVSDNGVQADGWVADVSCSVLGLNDENGKALDFSYYPNPVQDELNFVSKNPFSSIEIYSVDGKKVLANSYKKVYSTNVSMKQLPKGTYVVVVNFEGKSTSFKIVKK